MTRLSPTVPPTDGSFYTADPTVTGFSYHFKGGYCGGCRGWPVLKGKNGPSEGICTAHGFGSAYNNYTWGTFDCCCGHGLCQGVCAFVRRRCCVQA